MKHNYLYMRRLNIFLPTLIMLTMMASCAEDEGYSNYRNVSSEIHFLRAVANDLEFTAEDIAKILHLSSASIKKYLEKGCKIGICDYTPKKGKYRRDLKKIGKPSVNSMKIYYDGLIYDSIKEFSEQIGQGQMAVGRWLRGECRPKNKQKEIYLSAHYATDDEICRFPKFRDCVKQQESQNQGSLLLCSNE